MIDLYDIQADPACIHNLAEDANHTEVAEKLWKMLASEYEGEQAEAGVGVHVSIS